MKNVLYISVLFFIIGQIGISCEDKITKTYELVYFNRDKDTIVVNDVFVSNGAWIKNGDLYIGSSSEAVRSGVRSFRRIK